MRSTVVSRVTGTAHVRDQPRMSWSSRAVTAQTICVVVALASSLVAMNGRRESARHDGGCGASQANAGHWVDFVLTDVPASLRVPPDTAGVDIMPDFQDVWIGSNWKPRVDVAQDSDDVPIGGAEGPLPPMRSHVVRCVETVAGRPMRIATYTERGVDFHGDFVVAAVWPLHNGSWVRIGGVAYDTAAQRLLVDIVRTLRLDTVGTLGRRKPSGVCTDPPVDTTGWSRTRLSFAPVTLVLPRGAKTHKTDQPPAEGVEVSGLQAGFTYHVFNTPGWHLPKPRAASAIWCSVIVDGRQAAMSMAQVQPEVSPGVYEERAMLSLAPDMGRATLCGCFCSQSCRLLHCTSQPGTVRLSPFWSSASR